MSQLEDQEYTIVFPNAEISKHSSNQKSNTLSRKNEYVKYPVYFKTESDHHYESSSKETNKNSEQPIYFETEP